MAFDNKKANAGLRKDLDKAHKRKVVDQFVQFHKTVAIRAYREVTATANVAGGFGSPLWSGRFRASNNISIGSPDYDAKPPKAGAGAWTPAPISSPYPSRTPAEASLALNALKPFDRVFIANGVPYSRRIELDGWSAQTPNGVYNVTAENMRVRFGNVKPIRLNVF